MKYTNLQFNLVPFIEEKFDFKLSLEALTIIGIINSFHKDKKKCKISQATLSKLCLCSTRTIRRNINTLHDAKIIKIHKPKKQWLTKEPVIMHLHKDIKAWYKEITHDKLSDKMATNNVSNTDSKESSSFIKEDPFSSNKTEPKVKTETLLNKLIEL